MTVNVPLAVAGAMIIFGTLASILLNMAFCVRTAPRWMRWWRDFALALLGVRILEVATVSPDVYWLTTAIWLHAGAAAMAVGGFNARWSLGPGGDRCWHDDEDRQGAT